MSAPQINQISLIASMIRMCKDCPLKHSLNEGEDLSSHIEEHGPHSIISKKSLEGKLNQIHQVSQKNNTKWRKIQEQFQSYLFTLAKELQILEERIHQKILETQKMDSKILKLSSKDRQNINLLQQNKYDKFSCQQMFTSFQSIKLFIQNSQHYQEIPIDLIEAGKQFEEIIQKIRILSQHLKLKKNQLEISSISSIGKQQPQQIQDQFSMYSLNFDRSKSSSSTASMSSSNHSIKSQSNKSSFMRDFKNQIQLSQKSNESKIEIEDFEEDQQDNGNNFYKKLNGQSVFMKKQVPKPKIQEKKQEKNKQSDRIKTKENEIQIKKKESSQFEKPSKLQFTRQSKPQQSVSNKRNKFETSASEDEDCDDKSQNFEEDYARMLKESEQQLLADSTPQGDLKNYMTVLDLDDYKEKNGFKFNIRVTVVKIIYQSTLRSHAKIKFIAGDYTGVAVFFTNYHSQIKTGAIIDLKNCNFSIFKGSFEVRNDKNFRILHEKDSTIVANIEAFKLSPFISQKMDYGVHDSKCTLLRYAATKLIKYNKIDLRISKMMVSLTTIFEQNNEFIECIVADSSGMMHAYFFKTAISKNRQLKEGDSLVLRRVEVRKRVQSMGQIIFIGTNIAECKIYRMQVEMEVNKDDFIDLQTIKQSLKRK